MTIQIEEGKIYRCACGQHGIGPMRRCEDGKWMYSSSFLRWNDTGVCLNPLSGKHDLVAEEPGVSVVSEQTQQGADTTAPRIEIGQKWRWLAKFNATMFTKDESYEVVDLNGDTVFIDDDDIRKGDGTTHSWRRAEFLANFELSVPAALASDIKATIADEAKRIVSGARRSAYGKPEQNFERIARFWQAYFENTGRGDVKITAADVSPLMRLMKEARLAESPNHYDSFVDLIGYTLTGAEINKVEKPA